MAADSPFPEVKKSHTMARTGRPWTDYKPPPSGPVWNVLCGLAAYASLQAASQLGVFEEINRGGPGTAGELAGRTGCVERQLRILLDAVVVLGLLDQCADVYDLNDTARRYLLADSPASMLDLLPVAAGPPENWDALAETVRSGAPPRPVDHDAGFYVPLVEGTFATQLRVAQRADLQVGYSRLDAPVLLELGAGGAPWACAVLQACPQARATVNDFDEVLEVARRKTDEAGVAARCDFVVGDYHGAAVAAAVGEATPPGGYDMVVLGHLCRAEGQAGTRRLLELAHGALRPGGRLLVTDYFSDPTRKFNQQAVLMGAVMMANTTSGYTFTPGEFAELVAQAGFGQTRRVEPIGFQHLVVAVKTD